MTQSNAGGTNYQVQTGEDNTNFYGGEHTHNYPPTPDEIVGVPQNLPFSGTAKFVGRDEVLKQVRSELMAGSRLAITAIQGMGGIGKTELALQYALKFSEEYPGGICWLRARQEIATQIIGFGQSRLNLQVPDWLDDAHKQVAWCWQHWRSGKVLLIVDDVVDYGKVKEWLPQNDARFQVLMTTRETLGAGVIRLELSVLSDGAALELLESLIGEERSIAEKSGAIALCQWVGNLPLGLELIGRYLAKKEDLTLAEMLQRLQKKRLSSPAIDKVSQEMNAQLGVRDAFELSWAELDTAAKELAVFLSLFASSPISWQWVIDGLTTYDSEEIENARDDGLRFLHLLQRIGQGEYQLHPLVREFFGEKLQNDRSAKDVSQLQRSFAQVMTEIAKTIDSTGRIAMLDKVRSAIPHIAEVTKYVMLLEEENDQIWSFTGLAWFYQGQRLWQEAEEWSANCLRFVKDHFGDRHPHTATSLNNLALLYSSTGQYTRALPLHESALEIRQSELGNQHPHTAQSLNNLADLYVSLGQYDLALFLFESALEIRKTELGNRHPDVAASLNNLAYLYKLMGAYDQALPLYKSALKIYQLELGDLHPDTTKSLNNLAGLYYSMEQYNCALPLCESALKIYQSELGDRHPNTAMSRNNLAVLYRSMGQYDRALLLYESALEISQSELGDQHPDTISIMNNLAGFYKSIKQYDRALLLYESALKICKLELGDRHPLTASSLNNLAQLYESMGQYDRALPLYESALEIRKSELGNRHPSTATTLNNLATLCYLMGQYDRALPLYEQSVDIAEEVLGFDHPNTKVFQGNLRSLREKMGIEN